MRLNKASDLPGPRHRPAWRAACLDVSALGALLAVLASGCDGCSRSETPRAAASDAGAAAGLSPEQAAQVLARVGERVITLGDYAAALDRMDPFERMRYQTQDRRQALLDEMINVELLAREAERRGLDRRPETVELVRQFQRDELLRRVRASLPRAEDLPAADVSRYYQDHRQAFYEPERRRAAQIALSGVELGRRVLSEARAADPDRWRELVAKYAPEAAPPTGDNTTSRPPLEVPGDLGLLTQQPDEPADALPDVVRQAVFQIESAGQVYPELVVYGGRFHVVRLVSKLEARQLSLAEADGMIRARLVQSLQASAEAALIARLRQSTAVKVDEAVLDGVQPPTPGASAAPAAAPAAAGGP